MMTPDLLIAVPILIAGAIILPPLCPYTLRITRDSFGDWHWRIERK